MKGRFESYYRSSVGGPAVALPVVVFPRQWSLYVNPRTPTHRSQDGGAGHTDSVEAVAFSRLQPVAATGSMDGQLLVWDNSTLGVRSTCIHGEVRAMA